MNNEFIIISYSMNKDKFLSNLNECSLIGAPTRKQFQVESAFREATVKDQYLNLSFFVEKNGLVKGLVLCQRLDSEINYNGRPVEALYQENDKGLFQVIFSELSQIANSIGIQKLSICDNKYDRQLSSLGSHVYNMGGSPKCKFEVIIDLTKSEEIIHSGLRKSYKSLINQGLREINYTIINKENPNRKLFEAYREFHKKVAGRNTRSIESWDMQFNMLETGCAELMMGEMESFGLVSSTFCSDHGDTTFYGSGVYDRNLFDRPLSHSSVYKSMIRAKERGQSSFNMGIIHQKNNTSQKEYNIGNFKKGFCNKLSFFIEWDININKTFIKRQN